MPLAQGVDASLRALGIATAVAHNAVNACLLARQFDPSAIVVLGNLSNLEHQETIASLLIHPATSSLPVIAICDVCAPTDVVRAIKSGVVHISAPCSGVELKKTIDEVLGSDQNSGKHAQLLERRGPVVFRRAGEHLRTLKATGILSVFAQSGSAKVHFAEGAIVDAEVGGRQGIQALKALLAASTKDPWDFAFKDSTAINSSMEIEIDLLSLEGAPVVEEKAKNSQPVPVKKPLRVLVVDDDPDLVALYSRFMTHAGWEVSSAENGALGYDIAVKERPDAIVSDIMMPESDGWAFLTSVRDDYRIRETPFLLLSCHGDFLSNLEHLDAGADDYLQKGLRGEEVLSRVKKAASTRRELSEGFDIDAASRGTVKSIGIQNLVSTLSRKRASGRLELKESWSEHIVSFKDGKIVDSKTINGELEASGNDALEMLLMADTGQWNFSPGAVVGGEDIYFPEVSDDIAVRVNHQRENERENLLADDIKLDFDAKRLGFYKTVCADAVRPVVELLASGTPPRRAMVESDASPILVEWVVKDILRKKIAKFEDPNL